MPKYKCKGNGVFHFKDKLKRGYVVSEVNSIVETAETVIDEYPELELIEETRRAKSKTKQGDD